MSVSAVQSPAAPSPEEVQRYLAECVRSTARHLSEAKSTKRTGKSLYFTACDKSTAPNVAALIESFGKEAFDYKIVLYDSHEPTADAFKGCELIRRPGHKLQLAKELLQPESCEQYDYIFVWDADIDISSFSVMRFLELLYCNKVQLAQPALTGNSFFTWELTLQRPDKPGRFTDFVEIMVPCFSVDAWRTFREMIYLDRNPWGYGYDLFAKTVCGFDSMAIVDSTPVRHLQPVHSRQDALDSLHELQKEMGSARISYVLSYLTMRLP